MTEAVSPICWIENSRVRTTDRSAAVDRLFPDGILQLAQNFHRQIPGYKISPLKNLSQLAAMLGVGNIWVKDESVRLSLSSFKVLGGSFAIYRYIRAALGLAEHDKLSFNDLMSESVRSRIGDVTFATATDGNHGRGIAWIAEQLTRYPLLLDEYCLNHH